MISCNFPILDHSITLGEESTLFSVEDINIYSKIIFTLYQREQGSSVDYPFLLFDEQFKELSNVTIIQSPLSFDFNIPIFKKMLFGRIIATLDMDERQKIEASYAELVQYFNQKIFEDIDIDVTISEAYKLEELFKLLKINIFDNSTTVFERAQLILNVFHELITKDLIIFCGLGNMITERALNLIIETANLNQQPILFLENRQFKNLKNIKYIHIDQDYFCTEKML